MQTLNGYIAEFSGQPIEKVTADTDRDFFMSAQEAVEYGVLFSRTAVSARQSTGAAVARTRLRLTLALWRQV